MLDPEKHSLTEAEHRRIFERWIAPSIFGNFPSGKSDVAPTAYVLGGQPGAGKSAQVSHIAASHGGPIVQIIGDDYRAFHPRYQQLLQADDKTAAAYTDRDTGRWVEAAIQRAIARRNDLVIEGTMRSPEKVEATMRHLKAAGYKVEAHALAVPARLSWQGVLQRYEAQKADRGTGRMTTPEAHQAAYDGMVATLSSIERQALADRVVLTRRGGVVIYDTSAHPVDGWPDAVDALTTERARPLTLAELKNYANAYDQLVSAVSDPARRAPQTEQLAMRALAREARDLVAAAAFRTLGPDEGVKVEPRLKSAYQLLEAGAASARAGGNAHESAVTLVVAELRGRIAAAIERGVVPASIEQLDRGAQQAPRRTGPSR